MGREEENKYILVPTFICHIYMPHCAQVKWSVTVRDCPSERVGAKWLFHLLFPSDHEAKWNGWGERLGMPAGFPGSSTCMWIEPLYPPTKLWARDADYVLISTQPSLPHRAGAKIKEGEQDTAHSPELLRGKARHNVIHRSCKEKQNMQRARKHPLASSAACPACRLPVDI